MRFSRVGLVALVIVLLIIIAISPLTGQNETIITLYVPSWLRDSFDSSLFNDFEAQHPGVKVVLSRPGEDRHFVPAPFDIEEHLVGAARLAETADVIFVDTDYLSLESTRAGYFLNLMPLAQGDLNLDVDDFYARIWQAYQWDRGLWALPVAASGEVIIYSPAMFDAAGLSYPNEDWTLADLARSAEALTAYDADGEITRIGFMGGTSVLLASVLGDRLARGGTDWMEPDFSDPALADLLEDWFALNQRLEQLRPTGGYMVTGDSVTMQTGSVRMVQWFRSDGELVELQLAPLPGGRAGMRVQGFAVSAGTAQPELSYALASYLTRRVDVFTRLHGDVSARRSLTDSATDQTFGPSMNDLSPEVRQMRDDVYDRIALIPAETHFLRYLMTPDMDLDPDQWDELDAETRITRAEQRARDHLAQAEARRGTTILAVATPVATPSFGADQFVLHFGLNLYTSNLPNQNEWDALIRDFVASSPVVGNIELHLNYYGPVVVAGLQATQPQIDCFYLPDNLLMQDPFGGMYDQLLNIEPFVNADPDFNPSDFLPGVLSDLEAGGTLWGYPLTVQPEVLWYDAARFRRAGIPEPVDGWTAEAFLDALRQLDMTRDGYEGPLMEANFSMLGGPMPMLMAAFGVLPVDTTVYPPVYNLSDPAAIDGIRQALDLARDGLVSYDRLVPVEGASISRSVVMADSGGPAIAADRLSPMTSFRLRSRQEGRQAGGDFRLTTYPSGSQYTPVAYNLGAAYISADARDAQACYDWIKVVASRPDLLSGLPARQSQIGGLDASLGDDVMTTYQRFAEQLNSPNAIRMNTTASLGHIDALVENLWIQRAFDSYVLDGIDIETALSQAEANIGAYRECLAGVELVDISQLDFADEAAATAYIEQFTTCAAQVDPVLGTMFGP